MTIYWRRRPIPGAISLRKSVSCGTSFGHIYSLCQFMCSTALTSLGNSALLQLSSTGLKFLPTSSMMMPAPWDRDGGIQTSYLDMKSVQCISVCMSTKSLSVTWVQNISCFNFEVINTFCFHLTKSDHLILQVDV